MEEAYGRQGDAPMTQPDDSPLTAQQAIARLREMLESAPRCEGDITAYGGYDSLSVWMDELEALLEARAEQLKEERMPRSYTADSIEPTIPELAEIIASGLLSDSKAGRLGAIGIDQVQAAIDARDQGRKLKGFAREQLITLTLRKLINKIG